MYFIDRAKMEATLIHLEGLTSTYEGQNDWNGELIKLSLERVVHVMIESILDVGNAMIDGFIMRDPGSYEDIIDILEDETVVDKEQADSLKKVIGFRKVLVQDYLSINHEDLVTTLNQELKAIKAFPPAIRTYLENELGPVSAFKS
ncbi:type VII toxin-antitoxin system HepT family RNase toxin [Bacillus sp. AK128]